MRGTHRLVQFASETRLPDPADVFETPPRSTMSGVLRSLLGERRSPPPPRESHLRFASTCLCGVKPPVLAGALVILAEPPPRPLSRRLLLLSNKATELACAEGTFIVDAHTPLGPSAGRTAIIFSDLAQRRTVSSGTSGISSPPRAAPEERMPQGARAIGRRLHELQRKRFGLERRCPPFITAWRLRPPTAHRRHLSGRGGNFSPARGRLLARDWTESSAVGRALLSDPAFALRGPFFRRRTLSAKRRDSPGSRILLEETRRNSPLSVS